MGSILKRIIYKLARRKFVHGFDTYCTKKIGRILLYNKTEEYYLRGYFQDFSHPNNWESFEMGKILNRLGFVVDVIDRTATLNDVKKIKNEYDLFIGLGVGDSGQYFADIAARVPKAIRVLYAMGPEPDLSNKITKSRHDYFRFRHPIIPVIDRRLIHNVDTTRLYEQVDEIIAIGNEFSVGSYKHLGKPVHKVYLSTYPELSISEEEFFKKNKKKFLYFGGNGNITKGLDLVLEVFANRPDLELFIGAPTTEEDFNVFSDPIITQSPNIKRLGFVDVSSRFFLDVTAECGYVIMPSSSEGSATSVTTCMRRGLVPVVTIETGIEEVQDFGYLISEGTIKGVEETIDEISKTTQAEFLEKVHKSYKESFKYTTESFTESFETIIKEIIKRRKIV